VETAELRPLSLGELLDRAFTLYRGNFWLFVGIMAVPAAFGIPVTYMAFQFDANILANPMAGPPAPGVIGAFLGGYFIFWCLSLLLYSIVAAAITHAVAESYLGRRTTIAAAYKSVWGKVWRLFGVTFNIVLRLVGIMMAVGIVVGGAGLLIIGGAAAASSLAQGRMQPAAVVVFALFVIALYVSALSAMVYLALRYAVVIPALMLENLGVLAAVRRSVQLTRGRRGHLFIALLLAAIISGVGLIVFYLPFYIPTMIMMTRSHAIPAWLSLLTSVSAALGGAITSSIFWIVLVVCYYDTRIRKEAFDLQFMIASLDRPAPAAGTVPLA
jgi:hypothetical protein